MNQDISAICQMSQKEAIKSLSSSVSGIDPGTALKAIEIYGLNEVITSEEANFFEDLLKNLLEPMGLVLMGASLFSFIIRDWLEAIAIMGVVVINTFISILQDRKAGRALDELKKILTPQCRVIRKGNLGMIASKYLVPGDIYVFEAGDIVPADCRIIEDKSILADESHLTGESTAVSKTSKSVKGIDLKPYEMKNILFAGSRILNGEGKAIVVMTGYNTEIGKIAYHLNKAKIARTPLQKRLDREIKYLLSLAVFSSILVLLVSFLRSLEIKDAILISISLMVAIFPEGLPASITIALSLAVEKMAKESVIIKNMASVETLGNVDYICTDKTGTITEHNMTVKEYYLGERFLANADILKVESEGMRGAIHDIFLTSAKSSSARVIENDGSIIKEFGDPTETSLIKAGMICGYKPDSFESYRVLDFIPFSSDFMYSACLVRDASGRREVFIKGAPDRILSRCTHFYLDGKIHTLDPARTQHIARELSGRAEKGFRIIGFAKKTAFDGENRIIESLVRGLVFIGAASIYDPPRDEVSRVINSAHDAGIQVVMITGDSKKTALSIAKNVGIASQQSELIEGHELEQLDENDFSLMVEHLRVYSRVSPCDKLRIVEKLKEKNHTVAMTGDGVNDSPALKTSDVGIAMGRAGSQVAQEAASIILADDNLDVIVKAVREGRTLFQNIKKLVKYLITNNIGKVVAVIFTPLLGYPAVLAPIQILWSNIIMESLPSIALSMDPPGKDILKKRPLKPTEPLVSGRSRFQMILDGIIFGTCIMLGYIIALRITGNRTVAQTMAFAVTLISPQISIYIIREGNLLEKFLRSNPLLSFSGILMLGMIICIIYLKPLNIIFKTSPIMDYRLLFLILGLSIVTPLNRLILKYRD
jgi:Ca2+-transporting ATPase